MAPVPDKDALFDVAVLGGGIFGLWIARKCLKAGLKTCVIDKARPGSGASGGLLGALMPHTPDRWNPKKQFQFDALCDLPDEVAELEAETGLSAGYRRTGRLMPIRKAAFLERVAEREKGAKAYWKRPGDEQRPALTITHIREAERPDWLDPASAQFGCLMDTLSARIAPIKAVQALTEAIERKGLIMRDSPIKTIDPARGRIWVDGETHPVSAGTIILTAGYESFSFLKDVSGFDLGGGIKGQAVLLDTKADPNRPILYDDGTYVIVHDDGRTAIGSTSRAEWSKPAEPDPDDRAFLDKAYGLVPSLADAPISGWWAGVRPRARERDPIVGRVPGAERLLVATGGFKIGFGIAHRIADAVTDILAGQDPDLPPTFTIRHHIDRGASRTPNPSKGSH